MGISYEIDKITNPKIYSTHLYRETLNEHLSSLMPDIDTEHASHCKLVLIQAPAGYGKTTLLADFAQRTTLPCCWYFLDQNDTNKVTFLYYLVASIRRSFPWFGTNLDPLLTTISPGTLVPDGNNSLSQGVSEADLLDLFLSSVTEEISERFVLIFCNYQEINEHPSITQLFQNLLQKLPEKCDIIIESRSKSHLILDTKYTHRETHTIGMDLLRFNQQEVQALAKMQGEIILDDEEANLLANAFDGWIAGMLLGTHLGDLYILHKEKYQHVLHDSSKILLDRHSLLTYVANEIFKRNEEIYIFLRDISILTEITPALCDEVLQSKNSSERLHYLELNGLFVTYNNTKSHQVIYKCHPILRDLFYNELQQQFPERFRLLHERASSTLSARGNYEEAIYHALEAHADDLAASLIVSSYEQFITQGHTIQVSQWLEKLPCPIWKHHPKLYLIQANIYLMMGNHTSALPLLETAITISQNDVSDAYAEELSSLHIEIEVIRSRVLFLQGAYHQTQALCEEILQRLQANETTFLTELYMRLGVCSNLLGNFNAGITHLQKALQLWNHFSQGRQVAEVHSLLASAYSIIGNFVLAEYHIGRALALWDQWHDIWGKSTNLVRLGLLKQRQGAFDEAEKILLKALTLSRDETHFLRGQAYALTSLAELYQDKKDYGRSLTMGEDGLAIARQLKDRYLINITLCILAMTYLYMRDIQTALLLVSDPELQIIDKADIGYEQVIRDLVYGTILLYQHDYTAASDYLEKTAQTLQKIKLRREQIQVITRLAACHLAQDKTQEASRCMTEIATILELSSGYRQLIQIELEHIPILQCAVETRSEFRQIKKLLYPRVHKIESSALLSEPILTSPTILQQNKSQMYIRALSEPMVIVQDKPVTRWRMARSMELFFFLLDRGRPVQKEQILTTLWSEVQDQSNQTLHSTIYYLRKALGEACIVSHGKTYALDLSTLYGDNVWYDVNVFQNNYAHAKQELNKGGSKIPDWNDVKEVLRANVELYHGDYLHPFYSDWCIFRRDELRLMYLDVLSQLARITWSEESLDECMFYWQRMLEIDNCTEEAYHGLMRCYIRQGKRGLALRQYQRCQDVLQHELQVSPGVAIQNFYQRIKDSHRS